MKDRSKMHSDFTVKDVYTGHAIANTVPSIPALFSSVLNSIWCVTRLKVLHVIFDCTVGKKYHYMFADI